MSAFRLVSVLMPAYDEAENLAEVVPEVLAALATSGVEHEVVVVDDGSTDGTVGVLRGLCRDNVGLRAIRLRRNQGKSAALRAGLEEVKGDVVVLMDADGQDDPAEIAALLAALAGGLDLVTGHRSERQDRFLKRNTSRLYNWVTAWMSGVHGRDFNSGLKAMRREVADSLVLYGELHRYVPVEAAWSGFRVGEVPVRHRPRRHGRSKFGPARYWRGLFDLITVRFLATWSTRPLHLFGGVGAASALVGAGLLAWMLVSKLMGNGIGQRPALFAGILLVVVGVQLVTFGLLAELLVRVTQPRRDQPPVRIDPGDTA